MGPRLLMVLFRVVVVVVESVSLLSLEKLGSMNKGEVQGSIREIRSEM